MINGRMGRRRQPPLQAGHQQLRQQLRHQRQPPLRAEGHQQLRHQQQLQQQKDGNAEKKINDRNGYV